MRILLVLFLLQPCFVCQAQNQLQFNHFGIKEGLPDGSINALLKDKEGYFWIGTENGLVRYDGYSFKNYNLAGAVGIAKIVTRIYEDRKGNLWIGSRNGFYVYNRTTDMVENRSSVLPKNGTSRYHVNYFLEDKKGNVWIFFYDQASLTTEHIAFYNPASQSVTFFGNKEKGNQYIGAIQFRNPFLDARDKLWLTTPNAIFEYIPVGKTFKAHYLDTTGKTIQWFSNEDTASQIQVWFRVKNKGSASSDELCRYNIITNTITVFPKSATGSVNLFTDPFAGSNFIDSKKRIWFATSQGLTLFDSATNKCIDFTIQHTPDDKDGNAVVQICEDSHANFWCWLKSGLAYFNTATGAYTTYQSNNDAASNGINGNINHINLDNYGLPWFGVWEKGLQSVSKSRSAFIVYNNHPGSPHHFSGGTAASFAETADGNYWVGSAHGLYYWQPQIDSFRYIHFTKNITDVTVNAVMFAKDGKVWFSAYGNHDNLSGLFCYNPATQQTKRYDHVDGDSLSLPKSAVSNIMQDNTGTIWVTTYGNGICKFNPDTRIFTPYPFIKNNESIIPPHTTLDDKEVFTIHNDKEGMVWLGTSEGSLNKFNPRTGYFTSYLDVKTGFFGVTSIYDDENTLWAGTYKSGLFSLDKKTNVVTRMTEANGLLWDGCWGIQKDNHNNLWVASPRGFSIVNISTGKIRHLTSMNGLPADPSYFINEFYKTKEGKFLFNCKDGFAAFTPDDFIGDTVTPVIHIETVGFVKPQKENNGQKDSLIVRWNNDRINLDYNENRITFTYVGLLYQNASSVQYAYRLDGYDKQWIEAGVGRTATYTNLSPGTYTFHVKAANGDDVWSTKDDAVTLVIATPWWQTWWFYTLMALAAFGLIYLVYRYQLNQALKVERVRNRIASDLHDEIGSTLSAITLFSEMAHQQSKTAVVNPQLLKRINETAQKVTQTMRDIVWSVSTKNDSFDKMITHMHEHAAELMNLKGYELHFTADEKLNSINLNMEKRQNIYLIYKEALNNIIKYANGSNVWICLQREKAHLLLSVKDDGGGFNIHQTYNGNGLRNMQNRAAAIHGSIVISSASGGGCEVIIKVPV